MPSLKKGCVQIYTGDGKGKTTAALGLAMRAHGYGLDVLMLQFAKNLACAEHIAARELGIPIVQADAETPRDCAEEIMRRAHDALQGGKSHDAVDVLILDEVGEAMRRGFVSRADIEALIGERPVTTELVMTGRDLMGLVDLADLVTEMRNVKHYYDAGLLARRGIEY